MSVRINSNIEALKAQRSLDRASDFASRTMERLASGMRINRASDDAAGLAVAMGLNKDSRVFDQGVRNINDAVSYLNIADGALTNLSDITIRLKELATQAANGSYSNTQRGALDEEAYRLTLEFNRLVSGTSFNGRMVIQASTEQLNLQAGFSTLSLGIMDGLERQLGTGTFEMRSSFGGANMTTRAVADVNGDGKLDVLGMAGMGTGSLSIALGNGDGTFGVVTNSTVSGFTGGTATQVGDFNGDGKVDLYGAAGGQLSVAFGNGDGTFSAAVSAAYAGAGGAQISSGDANGDGISDISVLVADGTINVFLASAGGTITKSQQLSTSANGQNAKFGDFNGDGRKDLIAINATTGQVSICLGNGNGTFQSSMIAATLASGLTSYTVGDFDADGIDDLAFVVGGGGTYVYGGSQTGQLSQRQYLAAGSTSNIFYADIDGDGIKDLTTLGSLIKGNRDGSFAAPTSMTGVTQNSVEYYDFTGDGVLDAIGLSGNFGVWAQQTSNTTSQQYIRLKTVSEAKSAITLLDGTLDRINKERGLTGSYLSRLESALNTLSSSRENYLASEARIKDTDVAFETANLVRANILQQSASAILAQATQSPRLALTLLSGV